MRIEIMFVPYTDRVILIFVSATENQEIWIEKKNMGYCKITDGMHIFNYIPDQRGSNKLKSELQYLKKIGLIENADETGNRFRLTADGRNEASDAVEELAIDINNDPKKYICKDGLPDEYSTLWLEDGSKVYYKVDINSYNLCPSKYGTNDKASVRIMYYPENGDIQDLPIYGSVEELSPVRYDISEKFWKEANGIENTGNG